MRRAIRARVAAAAAVMLIGLAAGGARAAPGARPWIGVSIEAGARGVRVKAALPGTPAARAGLRAGDEILSIDRRAVRLPEELIGLVRERGVGDTVVLRLARGRDVRGVSLALEARPDDVRMARELLVGRPAPPLALADAFGPGPADLTALAGHVVVVQFTATWCGACVRALPRLEEWHRRWGGQGLRVLGVSSEERDVLERFADERRPTYTIARDAGDVVSGRYLVPALPTFVVIDRLGVVRHVEVGGGRHLDAVEAALRALLDRAEGP